MKIGDVGGVVAGFADHDAVEFLRRGVLLAPRRPLLGAPRVRLEAVVQEVVDHALPGCVLRPPQVGVGVIPTLKDGPTGFCIKNVMLCQQRFEGKRSRFFTCY